MARTAAPRRSVATPWRGCGSTRGRLRGDPAADRAGGRLHRAASGELAGERGRRHGVVEPSEDVLRCRERLDVGSGALAGKQRGEELGDVAQPLGGDPRRVSLLVGCVPSVCAAIARTCDGAARAAAPQRRRRAARLGGRVGGTAASSRSAERRRAWHRAPAASNKPLEAGRARPPRERRPRAARRRRGRARAKPPRCPAPRSRRARTTRRAAAASRSRTHPSRAPCPSSAASHLTSATTGLERRARRRTAHAARGTSAGASCRRASGESIRDRRRRRDPARWRRSGAGIRARSPPARRRSSHRWQAAHPAARTGAGAARGRPAPQRDSRARPWCRSTRRAAGRRRARAPSRNRLAASPLFELDLDFGNRARVACAPSRGARISPRSTQSSRRSIRPGTRAAIVRRSKSVVQQGTSPPFCAALATSFFHGVAASRASVDARARQRPFVLGARVQAGARIGLRRSLDRLDPAPADAANAQRDVRAFAAGSRANRNRC